MLSFFRKTWERIKNFSKKEESISDIIKREIKIDKKTRKRIMENRAPLWMPSTSSTAKITGFLLFAWIISHPTEILYKILSPLNQIANHWLFYADATRSTKGWLKTNLSTPPIIPESFDPIAIHAGVGAILVGLIFFVAGSLLDKNEPEKARVLLYKSYLFPLLLLETTAFFFFIGKTNWLAVIFLGLIAVAALVAFSRVITVLLQAHKLEEAKKNILISVTRTSFVKLLDREITKRIWFNCLYKHYENSEILSFSPFGFRGDRKDIFAIKATRDSYVKNVKLNHLEKIESQISKGMKVDAPDSNDSIQTSKSQPKKERIESAAIVRKSLNDSIRVGETLFEIKKELAEKIGIKKLGKLALSMFEMERNDTEAEARIEISKMKDRCISAINNQSTGELENIMRLYVELINEFFRYLEKYGGGFSAEQARQEQGGFGSQKLKPIERLSNDIREIFERGVASEDIDIIRHVAYLPMLLAQEAIDNKDHLIFREFLYFPRMLYERGYELLEKGNKKAAEFIFDRTWRYLKELSSYHLEPKIDDEDYPEQDFKDYAIHILVIFQHLIKAAFDKRDIDNFNKFLTALMQLFEPLGRQRKYNGNYEEIRDVYDELDEKREEVLFGLASWTLFILRGGTDKEAIKPFYDSIQKLLPNKIEDLTALFMRVHKFRAGDSWGWDWWEMQPDGGVHTIQTLEKLEQLFVVKSLSALSGKTDGEIQKINIPHNRDLAFLADGTGDLMKIIASIETSKDNWKDILDLGSMEQCKALRALLKKAHLQQEKDDLKRKREAPVSPEKILKFKESLIPNYKKSQPMRLMLEKIGAYSDKSGMPYKGTVQNKMGIGTVFDKTPFIPDDFEWHVHSLGVDEGFGFGQSMARGENERIIETIHEKAQQIQAEAFESTLEALKPSNVIIVATNRAIWTFFGHHSANYIPKWRNDFPKEFASDEMIEGVYQYQGVHIPIYEVYTQETQSSRVYILNKKKLGKFIQYSPLDKDEPKELQKGFLMIDVQPFEPNSNALNNLLDKPPDWLKEIETRGEQTEHLRERILIHVYERFEFKLYEKFVGYVIEVER